VKEIAMWEGAVFVGRKREMEVFKSFLLPECPHTVLYVYSAPDDPAQKGGLGKTWLLQEFIEYRDPPVTDSLLWSSGIIDFYYLTNRSDVGILRRMTAEIAEISGVTKDAEGATAILSSLKEYERSLSTILGLQAQVALKREMQDEFADWVRSALKRTGATKLMLFFDTFELIEGVGSLVDFLTWVLHELRDCTKTVIAGQNRYAWGESPAFLSKESTLEVLELPLGGFDPAEATEYLIQRGMKGIDSEDTRRISELVQGRPIMLALVGDLVSAGVYSVDQLMEVSQRELPEHLATRILDPRFPPDSRIILAMAHVHHRFDEDIFRYLLPRAGLDVRESKEIAASLGRYSFVKYYRSTKEFVLHDEMRDLVVEYVWPKHDRTQEMRRELSAAMIEYYGTRLSEKPTDSQLQSAFLAERLYHILYTTPKEGFGQFVQLFEQAREVRNYSLCHALLTEIDKFSLEESQKDRVELYSAELDLQEYRIQDASRGFEALVERFRRRGDETSFAKTIEGVGDCAAGVGELFKAVDCLGQALTVYQRLGLSSECLWITARIGEIYASIGKYSVAEEYLSRVEYLSKLMSDLGKDVDKRVLARAYTSLGRVYRRHGKLEQALTEFERGLELKREIGATWDIGLSLVGLGNVWRDWRAKGDARWSKAIEYYRSATEICSEARDLLGLTRALEDWGWLEWVMSSQYVAIPEEEEYHLAEATRLAGQSLELCERYGFYWDYAANYHTLLHVAGSRKDYAGEEEHAQLLYKSATMWPDGFMLHDAIMHLAMIASRKEDFEEMYRLLSVMTKLENEGYLFPYFRGRLFYAVAEAECRAQNYEDAFDNYCRWLTKMAEQPTGSAAIHTFEDEIALLRDKLSSLPAEQRRKGAARIQRYWEDMGLTSRFEKEYHQLVEVLDEVGVQPGEAGLCSDET
jgi:tetratricopeptide (TPR) repeat protein